MKNKWISIMLKRVIITFVILIVVIFISLFLFVNSLPSLPPETDKVITNVMHSELPELVTGKTGEVVSNGVKIWYEVISPKNKPKGTVLLIMGYGSSSLEWPVYFYQSLVDAGYEIIRFDHRGVGMSDWCENWDSNNPYTIKDMMTDALAVINEVSNKKVHVIGMSMGGMIAQEMAINHPERLHSLTCISSNGYFYDPDLPSIPKELGLDILKLVLKYMILPTEENSIKYNIGFMQLLKGSGDHEIDIQGISERTLYEMRKRNGYNKSVSSQHESVVLNSGSRYDKLTAIKMPALIIHGKSDPFVSLQHAEKYSRYIPNAKTLWIDGMGHEIHSSFFSTMLKEIIDNFQR